MHGIADLTHETYETYLLYKTSLKKLVLIVNEANEMFLHHKNPNVIFQVLKTFLLAYISCTGRFIMTFTHVLTIYLN
jgi:hypothetical protein